MFLPFCWDVHLWCESGKSGDYTIPVCICILTLISFVFLCLFHKLSVGVVFFVLFFLSLFFCLFVCISTFVVFPFILKSPQSWVWKWREWRQYREDGSHSQPPRLNDKYKKTKDRDTICFNNKYKKTKDRNTIFS